MTFLDHTVFHSGDEAEQVFGCLRGKCDPIGRLDEKVDIASPLVEDKIVVAVSRY